MDKVKKSPPEGPYYTVTKDGKTTTQKLFDVVDKTDFYSRDGVKIIKLTGVQKIADKEGIVEKKVERPNWGPNADNHQQHVIDIWVGFKGDENQDNWQRGYGEASTLNTGTAVFKDGKTLLNERKDIDSKYKDAISNKRAYCKGVLRIVKLYGIYADIDSPDFAQDPINL